MRLLSILKGFLQGLLSDARSAIVTVVVTVIGLGGLIAYAENLWNIMQLPIPLWATLSLVILASLLTMLNMFRASNHPKQSIFLIEDCDFKWKVTDKKDGAFSVDNFPYCKDHDSRLVRMENGQYMCREIINSKCDSRILERDDVEFLLNMATSKIDSHIGKYKTKI